MPVHDRPGCLTPARSLTQHEARERAALLEVERYDIEVDLRGMLEGGRRWVATSTVTFRCREPGASTFVDCDAEVQHATLNGVELDLATHAAGRLPLPDLAEHNVLVVSSVQRDTGRGTRSCAASTRRTSSSTSGAPSSPTAPGGPGPASTSPTSRRHTGSR